MRRVALRVVERHHVLFADATTSAMRVTPDASRDAAAMRYIDVTHECYALPARLLPPIALR